MATRFLAHIRCFEYYRSLLFNIRHLKIQSWNDAITTTADTSKVKGPIDGEVETGEENDLERIRPKSY